MIYLVAVFILLEIISLIALMFFREEVNSFAEETSDKILKFFFKDE